MNMLLLVIWHGVSLIRNQNGIFEIFSTNHTIFNVNGRNYEVFIELMVVCVKLSFSHTHSYL